MANKKIYQTLEDRGNADDIENHGPFPCKWENTWLGRGYYFWDTFMNNAHWWGKKRYNTYVICEADCEFSTIKCLDLVGCTEHLLDFDAAIKLMEKAKLVNDKTTVAKVVEFMKSSMKSFRYEAIRAYGVNSLSDKNSESKEYIERLVFEVGKSQYLDITPAIQICIFKKNGLNIKGFRIVFPEDYCADYVI